MSVNAGFELIGRDDERVRLRHFVHDLADGPGGIILRGEAGIGKTALWGFAVDEARQARATVLSTRCVEAELPLAFVGLADLLYDTYPLVADELAPHQRSALAIALGLDAPAHSAVDPVLLARAFLTVLEALSREAPVLVAVDDVQWLDAPSRTVVSFAARRLGSVAVGVLTTLRGDAPEPLGLAEAFGTEHFGELHLDGLSAGALAHLIRRRLDARMPRPVLSRVHAASGGNPLFAVEFARRLVSSDYAELGPLPLPKSLTELVSARVATYDADLRRLLAIAAANERPTLSLLHAMEPAAETLLTSAVDAGAVSLSEDGLVRFEHPLIASAVYSALAPSERRVVHGRLAEIVDDLEERARHLALATREPDARVAALLDEAAERASVRGAPDAAAELAEEAVRLTPVSDVSDREARAFSIARYLRDAGRHTDAIARIAELLASGLSGAKRARALLLAYPVEDDYKAAGRLLEEALDSAGDDLAVRARVLLMMSRHLSYPEEVEASEHAARAAVTASAKVDDRALTATALAAAAFRAAILRRADAEGLLEEAFALAGVHGTVGAWPTRGILSGEWSLQHGDLQSAREYLRAGLETVHRDGREYLHPRVLLGLFELEWRAGNWRAAEEHVDDLAELALDRGNDRAAAWLLSTRGASPLFAAMKSMLGRSSRKERRSEKECTGR